MLTGRYILSGEESAHTAEVTATGVHGRHFTKTVTFDVTAQPDDEAWSDPVPAAG